MHGGSNMELALAHDVLLFCVKNYVPVLAMLLMAYMPSLGYVLLYLDFMPCLATLYFVSDLS